METSDSNFWGVSKIKRILIYLYLFVSGAVKVSSTEKGN